jgi:hypothetical protein
MKRPPGAKAKAVGVSKMPKGGPAKVGGGVGGGNMSQLAQGLAAARPVKKPRIGNIATKQSLMRQQGGGI